MKGLFDPSGVVTHRLRTGAFDSTGREAPASHVKWLSHFSFLSFPIPVLLSLGTTKESMMVSYHKQGLTHRFWKEGTFGRWGNIQFTT